MAGNIKANLSKCAGCGDDMVFDPTSQSLLCPSCKSYKKIKITTGLIKHGVNENLTEHKNNQTNQTKEMQCPNCGAICMLNQHQMSASCQYCSTALVASNENFIGLKPDSIVPFAFDKHKAEELFKQKLKSKWLVPKKFKESISANSLFAFYFPAFVFEADCMTTYSGRLYNEETIREEDGSSHTKRKYFNISGIQPSRHENIEIEASKYLNQYELNLVRPYNLNQAKVYSDEFIFGFSLENYSNSVQECNKQAQIIMKQYIKNIILNKYNHDGVSSLDMQTKFSNEKFSYCVLPMYRISYSHNGKNYSNIMNGQTGKLGGNYPKSGWKIALIVIAIVAFLGLPLLLFILSALSII